MARWVGGVPLQFHLSPRPSVRNNALGVTPCIVASWLLCRPLKQQVKIEYSCLGLCYKIAQERVLERFHVPQRHCVRERAGYIVSMCAFARQGATAAIFAQGELRLITFVARTDFVHSPRAVRTGAVDKLLVIAASARCSRPSRRLFSSRFVRKLVVVLAWGAVALQSLCLHACVSMSVVRSGDTCRTVTNTLKTYRAFKWNINGTNLFALRLK